MLSDRDFVEANSFSRHRLVTAFVRGARASQDPDPPRPLRAVGGGLVLSALMLGVAAIVRLMGAG